MPRSGGWDASIHGSSSHSRTRGMAARGLARAEPGRGAAHECDIRCDTPPASAMISPAAPEMMVQTWDFLTESGDCFLRLPNKVGTDFWPSTPRCGIARARDGATTRFGIASRSATSAQRHHRLEPWPARAAGPCGACRARSYGRFSTREMHGCVSCARV